MGNWTPNRIKRFRLKHKLSQRVMGQLVGVTGNYIYLLEKEVKTPSTMLQLLLDFVEADLKAKEVKPIGNKKRRVQKKK